MFSCLNSLAMGWRKKYLNLRSNAFFKLILFCGYTTFSSSPFFKFQDAFSLGLTTTQSNFNFVLIVPLVSKAM